MVIDLMHYSEELESGSVPNMPVEIETDSAADKSFNRQYSEASTNTDQSRDSHQRGQMFGIFVMICETFRL